MCIYRFYYLWNSFLESREAVIKNKKKPHTQLSFVKRSFESHWGLLSSECCCGALESIPWGLGHMGYLTGSKLGFIDFYLWRWVTLLPPSIYVHPTEIHDRGILSIFRIYTCSNNETEMDREQRWKPSCREGWLRSWGKFHHERHREDSTIKVAGQRERKAR